MTKKKQQTEEAKSSPGIKIISENRKARFNYEFLEKYEAGIILTGAEIKSIREHGITLAESYIRPDNGELYLLNAHIRQYGYSNLKDYDPVRRRKLLLHRGEIDKLCGRVETKGLTIVPLKLYLKRGYAKIEIALARGKSSPDKRGTIREREAKRYVARVMKRAKQ